MTKLMQSSVMDKTYRYCNEKQCPYIISNQIANTDYKNYKTLTNLRLAIDDSCNLSCPSCRKQKIFLHKGKQFKLRLILVDKILKYIENNQNKKFNIHIGSDGDPFASLIYRNFMRRSVDYKNLKYTMLTNGLLIKKNFLKFKHVVNNLSKLGLSIDGATKKTYESLRRGGTFKMLLENLQFIKKLDRKFQLEFHCVVQKDNYQELYQYIEMAKEYNADKIFLNKITDWGVLPDFKQRAVWQPEHPEYDNFINIVTDIRNTRHEKEYFIETANLT